MSTSSLHERIKVVTMMSPLQYQKALLSIETVTNSGVGKSGAI
jgi:hypothetical protein